MRLAQDSGAGRDAMLRMLRVLISVVTPPSKVVSSVLKEKEHLKFTLSQNDIKFRAFGTKMCGTLPLKGFWLVRFLKIFFSPKYSTFLKYFYYLK